MHIQVYKPVRPRAPFCSVALFAFWLRSSVVSVLFSLISETVLRNHFSIILIFVPTLRLPVLAHSQGTVPFLSHYLEACANTILLSFPIWLVWMLNEGYDAQGRLACRERVACAVGYYADGQVLVRLTCGGCCLCASSP